MSLQERKKYEFELSGEKASREYTSLQAKSSL